MPPIVRYAGLLALALAATAASIGCHGSTPTQDAPRFALSGKVTDVFLGSASRGYLVLSDVSVTITGGPSQGSATTDSRGDYTITSLLAGTYNVSFTKASYVPAMATVEVPGATALAMSLGLDVPSPPSTSNVTGYWSGTGSYPNTPFKLALVQTGTTVRGTYLDGLDQGPAAVIADPQLPLPPYSPTRFTIAVNFGDAVLFLDCSVDGDRLITGTQRTSALGWNNTFPFTMTR